MNETDVRVHSVDFFPITDGDSDFINAAMNNTTNYNDEHYLVSLGQKIRLSFAILQLIAGTFGNVMSFLIMTQTAMRKTSAGVYFANIAVGDTIFLYLGLGSYIVKYFTWMEIQEMHPWSCKWVRFSLFMAGDTSVWLLVAVTLDRFVAVVIPTKANSYCVVRIARMNCVLVWLAAIIKNMHIFWTRGLERYQTSAGVKMLYICGFPTKAFYYFEAFVRPWIALTTLAAVPALVIFCLNVLIIKALKKQSQKRMENHLVESTSQSNDKRNVRQMTRMFLALSIEYLILVPPLYIFLIVKPHFSTDVRKSPEFQFAQSLIYALQYVHYSINFYLWCLSGRGFRKEVINMLGCRSLKSQRYMEMPSRSINNMKLTDIANHR